MQIIKKIGSNNFRLTPFHNREDRRTGYAADLVRADFLNFNNLTYLSVLLAGDRNGIVWVCNAFARKSASNINPRVNWHSALRAIMKGFAIKNYFVGCCRRSDGAT